MEAIFEIPLKGFSINEMSTWGRDGRIHQTSKYKNWATQVLNHLIQDHISDQLASLRKHFDPKKHFYTLELIHLFPYDKLFTKQKTISARAYDLTNIEKPLTDLIFLPKFYNRSKNLNIDDKYILDLNSKKRFTIDGTYNIKVVIKLHELKDVLEDKC